MSQTFKKDDIQALYELPFFELIHTAYLTHKKYFDPQEIELCTLSNIKSGGCPEDCAYCPQSSHYETGVKREALSSNETVIEEAKIAKANGAVRFCMGAAWRSPSKNNLNRVIEMIREVKALGLESCATLGMLDLDQAKELKAAGLDFYNHNLDTSPEFYETIITTRKYEDRLKTIQNVVDAGINVCCGGILGLGESRKDRIQFLIALSQLPTLPKSIPINQLIPIAGTPLEKTPPLESFELIKTIAVTRVMFPKSMIRLSAGRDSMSAEMQAWCFMAGANSVWIGNKLLTANNPEIDHDKALFEVLSLRPSCREAYQHPETL